MGVTVLGLVASTTAAQATTDQPDRPDLTVGDAPASPLPAAATDVAAGMPAGGPTLPLTLITGDEVHVTLAGDETPVVQEVVAVPRADDRPVAFHTITRGERQYVVPSDALGLLRDGVLDWRLFELAELAKLAADGTVGEVPVIVENDGGPQPLSAPRGATAHDTFGSIDATAMTVDGNGQWWRQAQAEADGAPTTQSLESTLAGVETVWLDARAEVTLDESVPQLSTEVAWELGYDGSGVTVAVLDTGIDPNHPDVAGEVVDQVDFTESGLGATDDHGHGTHVAATVAGTGEAADGQRPGVAPGADVAVGKVCTAGGSCPVSDIVAGMEWAAQSGADVVNMSLGGQATDGTDPMSQAVNQLSAEHGTLFVVAAGNNGPSEYTVGAPAAADAALAVAAVDKSDEMAEFSSRGPRVGDDALKPDIAAPGVDIVAARADGTSMGTPVDENYTTASGTSMASPHVAGGAAIVAQQNPELSGAELKELLMGTALDLGHDLYAQGTGRLDMGRAVDPTVYSDGNLTFGRHEYPHTPKTGHIGYTNVTDTPVTLSLDGSFTAGDGSEAPAGLLTLGADEVTVPADGTAEVEVAMDGSVLGEGDVFGPYRGVVEARDDDGDLRATSRVQAFLEPERHEVTVDVTLPAEATDVDRSTVLLTPVDDQEYLHGDPVELASDDGPVTADLFPGTYEVRTHVTWRDASGTQHQGLPTAPEVTVDGTTTVALDLRDAQRLGVDMGQQTETYQQSLQVTRTSATEAWSVETTLDTGYGPQEPHWWLTPTDDVSQGTLEVASDHSLVPQPVDLRAIAGGPPVDLDARYATPDVSVPGGQQEWTDEEGDTHTRNLSLPVPRLDSNRPLDLAYGGGGTAAELAGVDVDGAVVLIRPTDICDTSCDYPALRDRVAAAADAGAVGVLVAGESGPVALGTLADETIACADGFDSCPEVAPYAAAPVLSLPADQADTLVDRLSKRPTVKVQVRGDGVLERAYALSFTSEGRVPSELPYEVSRSDLDRVQHRIHDDEPSQTRDFVWTRITEEGIEDGSLTSVELPQVATQRSVTVFVGPPRDEEIARFQVDTVDFVAPHVVPPSPAPGVAGGPVNAEFRTGEMQERVLSGSDTLSWNTGPTLPGAVQQTTTDGGFTYEYGMCAGCREGNTMWPTMFTAGSTGAVSNNLIGMVNDTGAAALLFGMSTCEPPECGITMYDNAGEEMAQSITPLDISFGIGDEEETNR